MNADVIQRFLASSLQHFGLAPERRTATADRTVVRRMMAQVVGLALATGVTAAALAQPNGPESNSRVITVKPGAGSADGGQRVIDPAPATPAPTPAAKAGGKHSKPAHRTRKSRARRAASR